MDEFILYLQRQQKHHLSEAKKFAQDGRNDEANLEKVKANIFSVFATVAKIPNQPTDFLAGKMDEIPTAWHESLKKAIEHGDYEKELQERVKIAVMEEIKTAYASMTEGSENDC